jgi:hypothetical protein
MTSKCMILRIIDHTWILSTPFNNAEYTVPLERVHATLSRLPFNPRTNVARERQKLAVAPLPHEEQTCSRSRVWKDTASPRMRVR